MSLRFVARSELSIGAGTSDDLTDEFNAELEEFFGGAMEQSSLSRANDQPAAKGPNPQLISSQQPQNHATSNERGSREHLNPSSLLATTDSIDTSPSAAARTHEIHIHVHIHHHHWAQSAAEPSAGLDTDALGGSELRDQPSILHTYSSSDTPVLRPGEATRRSDRANTAVGCGADGHQQMAEEQAELRAAARIASAVREGLQDSSMDDSTGAGTVSSDNAGRR